MSRYRSRSWFVGLILLAAGWAPWCPAAGSAREGAPGVKLTAELEQAGARQVILVSEPEPGKPHLVALTRRESDWVEVFRTGEVAIGRNGFAPPGEKKEGDGRTPSGIYPLGPAFGYQKAIDSKMSYRQATEDDVWVDDPASENYNRWCRKSLASATSFELMKRADDLYKYGIVIGYNIEKVVPGAGSAIFFHVWSGPGRNTAGCVATQEAHLLQLLKWLDPSKKPLIVLGIPRETVPQE